ncbi:hypothetical protein PHYSODRAFT_335213 [Phytophthora sojae]|uniref:Uncharacterized protein n=1 Tax=Phytophthora sojae (strain P6497) TaxID=1094619 RepID=G4ZUG2_PHYSP|nr:hypothetical protein PHYSODRAFT_335213 [Phytophthora sojae]EGZ13436.1 hypothetical protein PHYSODRAFT_335213 [Phytophthora sojae]|eukprot:XP_009530865.1 hypothetical protein PHYSODRAFT_335213 [Phytophthora sojae]
MLSQQCLPTQHPPRLPPHPATAPSVRRLVALFESRAAVRTATRASAAAATSRTRVSTLIESYSASSTIASSSVEATDVARSSAVAAVETLDPRWSIQLLDAARFAEFQYGYSGFEAPAVDDQDQDQGQGFTALEPTEELHEVTAAAADDEDDEDCLQQAPPAELPVGPVDDADVKSYSQLLQEADDLLDRVHDAAAADAAPAVVEPKPSETQPHVRAAAAPQATKSRLLDFKQSAAFVGQCAQARRRRSAAAAKPQRPLWKL